MVVGLWSSKSLRIWLFIFCALSVAVAFQNCSPVNFTVDPSAQSAVVTESETNLITGMCEGTSGYSFAIDLSDSDTSLCFDNTLIAPGLPLGPICDQGPEIKEIGEIKSNGVPCNQVTVCGVAPAVEAFPSSVEGSTSTVYKMTYSSLPLGCVGQIRVEKNNKLQFLEINVPVGKCHFCEASNQYTCGNCPTTPGAKKDCFLEEYFDQNGQAKKNLTLRHGSSKNFYFKSPLPLGTKCASDQSQQERFCNDGVLSGTALYAGCTNFNPTGETPTHPPTSQPTPTRSPASQPVTQPPPVSGTQYKITVTMEKNPPELNKVISLGTVRCISANQIYSPADGDIALAGASSILNNQSIKVNEGDNILCRAYGSSINQLYQWGGDCSTSMPFAFSGYRDFCYLKSVNSNKNIRAIFEPAPITVKREVETPFGGWSSTLPDVSKEFLAIGSVACSADKVNAGSSTKVTCWANEVSPYFEFNGWTKGCSWLNKSCTFTPDLKNPDTVNAYYDNTAAAKFKCKAPAFSTKEVIASKTGGSGLVYGEVLRNHSPSSGSYYPFPNTLMYGAFSLDSDLEKVAMLLTGLEGATVSLTLGSEVVAFGDINAALPSSPYNSNGVNITSNKKSDFRCGVSIHAKIKETVKRKLTLVAKDSNGALVSGVKFLVWPDHLNDLRQSFTQDNAPGELWIDINRVVWIGLHSEGAGDAVIAGNVKLSDGRIYSINQWLGAGRPNPNSSEMFVPYFDSDKSVEVTLIPVAN